MECNGLAQQRPEELHTQASHHAFASDFEQGRLRKRGRAPHHKDRRGGAGNVRRGPAARPVARGRVDEEAKGLLEAGEPCADACRSPKTLGMERLDAELNTSAANAPATGLRQLRIVVANAPRASPPSSAASGRAMRSSRMKPPRASSVGSAPSALRKAEWR